MVTTSFVGGVIVADDDEIIRCVLRNSFEAFNLNVFLASNGLEAVELATNVDAALIILDLKMPRLDGLLASQRIRQIPGNAQTPIIILTAVSDDRARLAATKVGANMFIKKPFRPAIMLQAVANYLPITDADREAICANASRVKEMTRTAWKRSSEDVPVKHAPGNPLDRGIEVLQALRRT
jgi:CheY-like chemotaxis protein